MLEFVIRDSIMGTLATIRIDDYDAPWIQSGWPAEWIEIPSGRAFFLIRKAISDGLVVETRMDDAIVRERVTAYAG